MADAVPRVAGDEAQAGRRRRGGPRRGQVRRLMAMAGGAQPLQVGGSSSQGGRRRDEPEEDGADKRSRRDGSDAPPPTPFGTPGDETPAFGCVSLSGCTRDMEDAVSLKPGFFFPRAVGASPMHFFAVFDGHGGSHVAKICKEWMHVVLAEELRRAEAESEDGEVTVDAITAALDRCFSIVDELVLSSCTCGSVGGTCDCKDQGKAANIAGSTAVVALLDRHRVFVANCGDSRAVLARGGRARALSEDHKPDRPDELVRIQEAGGRVLYTDGPRVLGILAMSRALGDKYLKPSVISEPETTITPRHPEDEFLVIASDGLWDVITNRLACDVVRRYIRERSQAGEVEDFGPLAIQGVVGAHPPWSHCAVAASLLARLALARKSTDNISVIVVDLKRH